MARHQRGLYGDEVAMVAGLTLILMCLGAALFGVTATYR